MSLGVDMLMFNSPENARLAGLAYLPFNYAPLPVRVCNENRGRTLHSLAEYCARKSLRRAKLDVVARARATCARTIGLLHCIGRRRNHARLCQCRSSGTGGGAGSRLYTFLVANLLFTL